MNPLGIYRYHDHFCTGTEVQPDTLSIFVKTKEGNFLVNHTEPGVKAVGKLIPLVGSYAGVLRVIAIAKAIFKKLFNSNDANPNTLRNLFINLIRAIADACPFSGIFLIIYDSVQKSLLINPNISKQIHEQNNIAGIAIDGKVCITFSLEFLCELAKMKDLPTSDKDLLTFFNELVLRILSNEGEQYLKGKRTEILPMNKIFAVIETLSTLKGSFLVQKNIMKAVLDHTLINPMSTAKI